MPSTHAPISHAHRRTALTSAEMSPARESGRSAGPWNTAGLWNATGAWNTLGAWNIAVRTRGVFTHRDDFQKPACVERGLVRTAMERGETKRRKPERTESDDNRDGGKQGKAEDAGRKGEGAKKRPRGEKASKKCSNMAKRAQIASLAISRGGGGAKRLYLRRAEHLEHRSIALRRRRRRRRGDARLSDRKRKRRGKARAGGTRRD